MSSSSRIHLDIMYSAYENKERADAAEAKLDAIVVVCEATNNNFSNDPDPFYKGRARQARQILALIAGETDG